MLIQLNRKILLKILDDKELCIQYISNEVWREYEEVFEGDVNINCSYDEIAEMIFMVVCSNEEMHLKYGTLKDNGRLQVDETMLIPYESDISGYAQKRNIIICPFDWSWDDNGDFDYSFSLARSL